MLSLLPIKNPLYIANEIYHSLNFVFGSYFKLSPGRMRWGDVVGGFLFLIIVEKIHCSGSNFKLLDDQM